MSAPCVDTDVVIRLVTGDDPAQAGRGPEPLPRGRAGDATVAAPYTVIADAVFVLSSPRTYGLPRAQVAAILMALVQLPRFPVETKRAGLRALSLYGGVSLDFGDAMLVAAMEQAGARDRYSFDHDFDRFARLSRREP